MGFYLRDEYLSEYERSEKQLTAAGRQLPTHLSKDRGARLPLNLSLPGIKSLTAFLAEGASLVSRESARYWRRASSRVVGIASKTIEGFISFAAE